MIGETIGRYEVTEKLGEGGMGEVYLARDPSLDRRVAIKVLPPSLAGRQAARQRFVREARLAAALDHPYICKIYEVGADRGRDFIAMEYVEGETLAQRLERGPMPEAEALRVAVEVAEALQKAHSRSIAHRDLKPANLMSTADGHVKVMDFGLAKAVEADDPVRGSAETLDAPLTRAGALLGTPGYMSPEQIRGEEADERSDLFSLGVVLYEMLKGAHPFRRATAAETLAAMLYEEAPGFVHPATGDPTPVGAILERLLAKDRDRRFATPGEVLAALRDVAAGPAPPSASAPRAAAGVSDHFSIAVLPFANMSSDRENDFLADGLAEELINELARLDGVKVVARTSAFQFRGKDSDVRDIGARLDVGTVLEGSVRAAGRRLRVTAQLIDVKDGCHLWSERYDREMTDILDIQDEIAAAILARMKTTLGEVAVPERVRGENPEAHRVFLRARHLMHTLTPAGMKAAGEGFERVLAIDPSHADAHAALAWLAINSVHFGGREPAPLYEEARAESLRALEISDAVADAHGGLAFVHMYADWSWAASEREFLRALELAPSSPMLHMFYGCLLSVLGRHGEAVAEALQAQQLDPLAGIVNGVVGLTLGAAGRFSEAVRELDRGIELDPAYWLSYSHRAVAHFGLGDYDHAAADWQTAYEKTQDPLPLPGLIVALERSGRAAEAADWLAVFEGLADGPYLRPYHRAGLELMRGKLDEGFAWLEKSLDARDGLVPWFPESPLHRGSAAAADPRFAAARARLGLPRRRPLLQPDRSFTTPPFRPASRRP